jgi:hypothetical protein
MKKILFVALFVSAAVFAQNDATSSYAAFKQEFEAYRDSPEVSSENSTIKPAPCGQYTLKFMITGAGFNEVVTTPPARRLCADLNRFDKSKNPDASADWTYEIKPVGNRYYVIRAEKKGGVQEFYYYERKGK